LPFPVNCCAGFGCRQYGAKIRAGMGNMFEIVRRGVSATMNKPMFDGPDAAYGTVHSRQSTEQWREGIGIYEVVTAPFPPYDPVCTDYLRRAGVSRQLLAKLARRSRCLPPIPTWVSAAAMSPR